MGHEFVLGDKQVFIQMRYKNGLQKKEQFFPVTGSGIRQDF